MNNTILQTNNNLSPSCSNVEYQNALETKKLHDAIEVIAYKAFAEIVGELKITQDQITPSQSGQILRYIKKQAHVELYKEGGYWKERLKLLGPSQFAILGKHILDIIHDRDGKLTDARYTSLSQLLMGLDDHNHMVKEILLQSWMKNPAFTDCNQMHLKSIKKQADFYPALNRVLKFDLEKAVDKQKALWDKYFPGKRNGDPKEFTNILEVRAYFGDSEWVKFNQKTNQLEFMTDSLGYVACRVDNLDMPLAGLLDKGDIRALFEARPAVENLVRNNKTACAPLLDQKITVKEFLKRYFPELLHIEESESKMNASVAPKD